MREGASSQAAWRRWGRTIVDSSFLLLVFWGVLLRIVGLPIYAAESGDEWGNMIAPLRILYEAGDPNTFIHPSFYYYVTAGVYVALFWVLKLGGIVAPDSSMSDLLVADERFFIFAARGVSVFGSLLAMYAMFALARLLWGRRQGLIAAAMLSVLPLHVLYSKTARVDSLFLALFIAALYPIVQVVEGAGWKSYRNAGILIGLATSANYNGALLGFWLIAAHLLRRAGASTGPMRPPRGDWSGWRPLVLSLGLALSIFFLASPFILINFATFLAHFIYQSGLSAVIHTGWEERAFSSFYVQQLWQANPYCLALVAASALSVVVFGNRAERFVLSLPVVYLMIFSTFQTKDERFILPAMALFLLVAAGMPFIAARLFRARPMTMSLASAVCYAPILLSIPAMAVQSIPIQAHELLAEPKAPVLGWVDEHARSSSRIVVESSVVPILDSLQEEGRLADALRSSVTAVRPNLDHEYIGAVFVGGRNYDAGAVVERRIDYAILRWRNVLYIQQRCGAYPDVCAFYQELQDKGRLAYRTPDGYEPVLIYEIPDRVRGDT